MSSLELRYALVTPVRDDAANLERLAASVEAQTLRPARWLIVDNGSVDTTRELAARLEGQLPFVHFLALPLDLAAERGGPIVRAFQAGLDALDDAPDVIVKLDADVSFGPDHFEHLLREFADHERLGIASGSAWELVDGVWEQQHMTGDSVWGAARAYRRSCLEDVLPLEERMGWDGIDALKAAVAGWETRTILDLPFFHHRPEGLRDGRRAAWRALGRCAYFMGYRPSYQLVRTAYHVRRDPAAVGLLTGYLSALVARETRCSDPAAIAYLREKQRLRSLLARRREALGIRAGAQV